MTDPTRATEPHPLVGLTITAVEPGLVNPEYDDQCIRLTTSDGRRWLVRGSYGDWTGGSEDEYPEYVSITEEAS